MNTKAKVNTVNKLLKTTKFSIDEAMIIPKSVWGKLAKSGNYETETSMRDRIHCIPRIGEKR